MEKYSEPKPEELISNCTACGADVISALNADSEIQLLENFYSRTGVALKFNDVTGAVECYERRFFKKHTCTKSGIFYHRKNVAYNLRRRSNPNTYAVGDSVLSMNFLDDDILRTKDYDCPTCGREKNELCKSIVNYRDGRIKDNKNCHEARRHFALKEQGLFVKFNSKTLLYELSKA